MDTREKLMFAPLVAMTLLLGVYPALITDVIGPSTEALVDRYNAVNGIVPAEPALHAAAETTHEPAAHAAPSH